MEFEGKNVEKAVQKACEELNVSPEKLKHDVISYGSTGIFGLVGTKKARIRVAVPEQTPKTETVSENLNAELSNDALLPEINEIVNSVLPDKSQPSEIIEFPEDPIELCTHALQRIVDFITTEAQISVTEDSDRFVFNVKGGNSAVLIGKRGQTLEAIQYLVEKMVNKRSEKRIRIHIDIEGYLETRQTNLQRLAGRLAHKAKRTGKPVTIGQMNAHDRRIVHLALKDDNRVRTQSMGDGYMRKLMIFPRKNANRNKRSAYK
jgi:spoIIIJ-associated protein